MGLTATPLNNLKRGINMLFSKSFYDLFDNVMSNKNLSLEAKGMYSYLLAKYVTPDYTCTIKRQDVCSELGIPSHVFNRCLRQLTRELYVFINRINGKYPKSEFELKFMSSLMFKSQ